MTITREMPVEGWLAFLREFNARNYARPARLETTITAGEGPPLLAQHEPLLGVELDPKGSEAVSIMVSLGGLEAQMPQFTHVIPEPTRLWFEEEPHGLAVGLNIESKDNRQTRLTFEREAALPAA